MLVLKAHPVSLARSMPFFCLNFSSHAGLIAFIISQSPIEAAKSRHLPMMSLSETTTPVPILLRCQVDNACSISGDLFFFFGLLPFRRKIFETVLLAG